MTGPSGTLFLHTGEQILIRPVEVTQDAEGRGYGASEAVRLVSRVHVIGQGGVVAGICAARVYRPACGRKRHELHDVEPLRAKRLQGTFDHPQGSTLEHGRACQLRRENQVRATGWRCIRRGAKLIVQSRVLRIERLVERKLLKG